MSELVNVKINGKDYKVPGGVNLIDAADSVGVHIPNLCYLKGMKGIGACRMCFVEANGKTMVACIMRTKEGMEINTETERISELRSFVVDMLISMHPLDCMTCTKAGVCDLQKYAYDYGVKESSYGSKSFNFPVDDANPFIKRDPDYCILCGRCVRVCKGQGTSVLEFAGRGVGSKVTTAADKPLQDGGCTFCGSCVDVCPVNALVEADRGPKGRQWEFESKNSICTSCGCACELDVNTLKDDVAQIKSGAADGAVENYICAVGRYGYDSLRSDQRVLEPMKKVGDKLEPTSWEDAINIVSDKLKDSNAGIVATGSITNEDALLLSGLGVQNVATTVSLYGDSASLIGEPVDLEGADLIALVGLSPSQWTRTLPALDAIVRKKADRKAKVVVINSKATKYSDIADVAIEGDEAEVLKAVAKAMADGGVGPHEGMDLSGANVTENDEKVDVLFKEASSPLIITSPNFYEAAQNVAFIKGSVVSMPVEANAKGVLLMGLTGKGKTYKEMVGGGVSSLYVVGDLPVASRPSVDFLVVQSPYIGGLAKEADVVFPACASLECGGSIVDYLGRLREKGAAVSAVGDAKTNAEIIMSLAKAMGSELSTPSMDDVKAKAGAAVKASVKPFAEREDIKCEPLELFEAMNSCVVSGSRLTWLKEAGTDAEAA